ncbi:MAG: helix-turn-helix transcriptional regulator [Saprospiraceae bacterium]|nr:helix-turn-helix transcriptional regulator [Saprospiraceae bacterium]
MSKNYLGEFEELVLLIVGALQEEAYGNNIMQEIIERTGRPVNLSAVHITLYRLEDKGYLKSDMSDPSPVRGGRRKRIFHLTSAGVKVLREQQEQRIALWQLIPQLKF